MDLNKAMDELDRDFDVSSGMSIPDVAHARFEVLAAVFKVVANWTKGVTSVTVSTTLGPIHVRRKAVAT